MDSMHVQGVGREDAEMERGVKIRDPRGLPNMVSEIPKDAGQNEG